MRRVKGDLLSVMDAQWREMKEHLTALEAEVRAMALQERSEVTGSVQIFANLAAFPAAGQVGRVAATADTGEMFFDNGTAWVKVSVGALLGQGSYIYGANLSTTHSVWTPVDSTNMVLIVTAVTSQLEVHWCFTASRTGGGPSPGNVDIGYDAGGGSYTRYGDTTYGMERTDVGDVKSFHLTAFFNVTPGTSYTFYLMDTGANPTYPNLFFARVTNNWWAIAR
jgi:hypothetical protein